MLLKQILFLLSLLTTHVAEEDYILTTNAQHSIKQYLHLTGIGPNAHSPGLSNLPVVGISSRQPIKQVPTTGLSALSALSLPALVSALQGNISPNPSLPPLIPSANSPQPNVANGGLDSNVINNLAIALQLLILSNIMNNPPSESTEQEYEVTEKVSYPKPVQKPQNFQQQNAPYPQTPELQYSLPNANFVGSSGFADSPNPMYSGPTKSTLARSSMTLMSPYEALAPSSSYSEPILSYRSNDFQSPYASVLGDNGDLFSMQDLF